jgi:hypothetical protein
VASCAIVDHPAAFAVYMRVDGGKKDEEFFALPAPDHRCFLAFFIHEVVCIELMGGDEAVGLA